MPGEFGPFVAPGWPDLRGPDLAGGFMQGAALGANINKAREQLERQMMQMSLNAQTDKINSNIREAEYRRKLSEGEQRQERADEMAGLRAQMDAWSMAKQGEQLRRAGDLIDNEKNRALYFLNEGVSKNDPDYAAKLYRGFFLYPGKPGEMESMLKSHSDNISQQERSIEAEKNDLLHSFAQDVYTNPLNKDPSALARFSTKGAGLFGPSQLENVLIDPNKWTKPDYQTESGDPMPYGTEGARFKKDPTTGTDIPAGTVSVKMMPVPGDLTNQPTYIHISPDAIQNAAGKLIDINKRKIMLPRKPDVNTNTDAAVVDVFSRADKQRVPAGTMMRWYNGDTGQYEYGVKH